MIIKTSSPSPSLTFSYSLNSSYFSPLNLIENPDKYYEVGKWQAFVREDESITEINSIDINNVKKNSTNDDVFDDGIELTYQTFQYKSGSSTLKTSLAVNPAASAVLHDDLLLNLNRMNDDDLQHKNSFSLPTPTTTKPLAPISIPATPSSSTVSLLASSPGSDIQFDRDNSNVWKIFLFSYARGNFNPLIIPKKPTKLNLHRRNKNVSHYRKMSIHTSPLNTECNLDDTNHSLTEALLKSDNEIEKNNDKTITPDNVKDIISDKDFDNNEWRNSNAQHMEEYSFNEHDTNIRNFF
ncbi:13389_t:CDS:2 [Funneliformis caledonium]|uniref:13389_t:CDS:1 n=1 Tax=Funneliformis caledonium TaxID=1117310 RepID=A0A9N9F3G7_9GLOM|nr:13389_t:CDS:2 [Funneliformis caledonium]